MPDIGATLREARMRAKIDISEVEAETKIRAKYLRALENEEWNLLPGATFVKTFLRTYADYLGLDPRVLVEEYKARYEPMSTAELQPFKPQLGARRERIRPRGPGRGMAVGVVVVLLIGALFALGKFFPNGGDDGRPGASTPRPATAPAAGRARARRRQRTGAAAPASGRARRVRLQLLATGPVWVCLLDSRGRRLIPGRIVRPGEARSTFTSRRFSVLFGNGRVDMKLNGRTLAVPDRSGPIGYSVTARGRRELPAKRLPSCA
jgi:cytoskeleton protein RodZ